MKRLEQMTKAELVRQVRTLERRACASDLSTENERLLRELQGQRIELETQNQDLREAQRLLEVSRDRFADLYDFAPVGYVTWDGKGVIREVNLTAAGMLGAERTRLLGIPFSVHVHPDDLVVFREHLRRLKRRGSKATTELRLVVKGTGPIYAKLTSSRVVAPEGDGWDGVTWCRTAFTDISARRQAEESLRESAELNQGILGSLNAQIAVLDRDGNIIAVNDAWNRFSQMNGGASGDHTGTGVNYLDVCRRVVGEGRADAIKAWEGIRSVLNGILPSFTLDYACDSPTERRWFQMSVTPLAAGGHGAVISHLDISRLRSAEAALSEKEARLRAVLQTAAEGIVTIDEHGIVETMNQAAEKLFGYPAKEVVGRNVSLLMPSPHRELHDRYLANYRRTGEAKIIGHGREVAGRRKDGSIFPLELSVSDVPLAGRRIFTGFVRDVTERRRNEELLRASELRYRTLFEASPDAVLVLKHGHIDFINQQGLRLLGAQSPADALGRSPFDFFARDRHEVLRRSVVNPAQGAGASPLIEEELVRRDGSRRWVSVLAAMFTEHGENAVQFILRDITERKKLEAEILEISEREQRRFGQDLHDGLGQRLTGLEMLSHGLAEDLAKEAPAFARQARRLNRELRATVTEARLISHSLAPVPLSGDGLMRGLRELAASTSRLSGVKCGFACEPPVDVEDTAVATHLYRIAQEAVSNALKHGRAKRLEISLQERAGVLELSVQNDGRPLPARPKGRGMGLNVMRYRAETIGASLLVEPAQPKGVKVTCTLRKKT